MKTSVLFTVVVLMLAGLGSWGMAADEGSWTGWVADENCAKDYKKAATPDHVNCATACLKRGGKLALSTKEGHFLLDLDPGEAEQHLGHEVVIKGELKKETNTIKVSSVSGSHKH